MTVFMWSWVTLTYIAVLIMAYHELMVSDMRRDDKERGGAMFWALVLLFAATIQTFFQSTTHALEQWAFMATAIFAIFTLPWSFHFFAETPRTASKGTASFLRAISGVGSKLVSIGRDESLQQWQRAMDEAMKQLGSMDVSSIEDPKFAAVSEKVRLLSENRPMRKR